MTKEEREANQHLRQIGVKIPADLHAKLQETSKVTGMTATSIVSEALWEKVVQLKNNHPAFQLQREEAEAPVS